MRIPLLTAALCLTLGASNVMARNPMVEPQAMLYYSISFDGGKARDDTHSFGLRMDQVSYAMHDRVDFRRLLARPALLDLQLGAGGVQALYISGQDYLRQYRVLRAAEDNGAADGAAAP